MNKYVICYYFCITKSIIGFRRYGYRIIYIYVINVNYVPNHLKIKSVKALTNPNIDHPRLKNLEVVTL